ncbi:MAG: Omp28-related outer membrane protein [Bacteroidota bacterium]|nr:Omp28-related outer membrane protein [Bacteroidota bacterium]
MKKNLYLLLALSGLAAGASAQTQRMVLSEEFTNASCPPCASQNPAFNALLASNTSKVVSIKYQTVWPGVDPMNAQNQSDVATRVTYYNVTGVPYAPLDGSEAPVMTPSYAGAPANWTQSIINTAYAIPAPFSMTVAHTMSANFDSAFVTITVTAAQSFTASGNLMLRVGMIEKQINFATPPGTNGEMAFENVMRKMYPNAGGTNIGATWTNAQTMTYTYNVPVPSYIYDINQVAFVAYIQDDGTKAVQQAAVDQPQLVANDAGISSVTGLPAYTCTTTINPVATITNWGSSTLTSATINYQLDASAPMTYNWTGSLATAATASQALPAITTTTGSHTLTVWTTNPNGVPDFNAANDQQIVTFSIIGTGTAAPYSQNFATTGFPYANWTLINNDGGATWTRVATNSGSMKKDNYNDGAQGEIDETIITPMDFSSLTTASLQFDLAYTYYTDVNGDLTDSLDVMISTNCGVTWTSLYYDGGQSMSTIPAMGGAFTPTSAQWTTKCFNLNAYAGQSHVLIKFKSICGYGNNLYIDNIAVQNTICTVGITEASSDNNMDVYPNPVNLTANINLNLANTANVTVEVYTVSGALVSTVNQGKLAAGNNVIVLDAANLAEGMYFVKVTAGESVITKKITVAH